MQYDSQKEQFEIAYRTGSDIWTHHNFSIHEKEFIAQLPDNGLVLDLGAGRGRFTFRLAESGLRVIGLEYVGEIVEKNNEEVKLRGMDKNVRFFEGDALEIPFTDESFDGIADVGLMHHLLPEDFTTYKKEVMRVLKRGGMYLLVALSKETTQYLSFEPKVSTKSDFEYEHTHFHFFTEQEIAKLFGDAFLTVARKIEYLPDDFRIAYEVVLMQRK